MNVRVIQVYAVYQPVTSEVLSWHQFKKDADEFRKGLRDVVVVKLRGTYAMPRHLRLHEE